MSPAGLKGVAEEVGLEMVVICGQNMGDIFRRNAFNLGLHVVQCPEAVADAKDGDEFTFDPVSRAIDNVTQGKRYTPVAAVAKRRRDSSERRHLRRRPPRVQGVGRGQAHARLGGRGARARHDDDRADRVGASGGQRDVARRSDSRARRCASWRTLLPASDGTAPFAIHTFNQITGGNAIFPRQAAVANDHFVFTGKAEDEKQTSIGRAFAAANDMKKPYYATPGDGIFHFYFPEQGLVLPGQFIPGADSHSRAYGAYGAVGIGVGSTTLGFGWSTGYIYFTLAKQRRVVFTGKLNPWVGGKDIVLELLRRWGAKQSQGMSVEFVDRRPAVADGLAQHDREHDGGGRGAERDLRARRDDARLVPREGHDEPAVPAARAGRRTPCSRSTRRSICRRRADDRQAVQSRQRVSR